MIEFVTGNIFDADVEALVNPVNCQGVMGKGLALEFKKRFPDNYRIYKELCYNEDNWQIMEPGDVLVTAVNNNTGPKYIFNFATKDHWSKPSKIEYIEKGLKILVKKIRKFDIKYIAIPKLGCGLGGLEWEEVKKIMKKILYDLIIHYKYVKILIYE